MDMINRRQALTRTGLALGAMLLARSGSAFAAGASSLSREGARSWGLIRAQFSLNPALIHMAGFFLASHPAAVSAAIERHRRGFDADPIGYWLEHEASAEASVLRAAGEYLGVDPTEIALTDSTTMGLGLLYGGLAVHSGHEILTTTHDHYSTDMSLRHRAERTGATVRQVPLYRDLHAVSKDELVETLLREVRPATRIVAVTWVHSGTGLKLPIRDMAAALAQVNMRRTEADRLIFCVDGVHALGVEDIRLPEVGCDFFIAGTHKWMFGPRGTGLVWGHPRAWPIANPIIPTFNTEAYDMWTQDLPARPLPRSVAMTPGGFHSFEHRWALDHAFAFHEAIGKKRVRDRIYSLNVQLKTAMAGMSHVTLHTPLSQELSAGIVCFEVRGLSPGVVVERLRQRAIVGSVTPYATHYARLAPGLLNSPEEVQRVIDALYDLRSG
ncbi:MAG: aminotransferase class V-fold PLP-dependent enzyme [Nitrospiraceae bacterium]|nr:aminotransferase class V-fold PLP-dependent enzyme [Nitrospiraceae bacterium]